VCESVVLLIKARAWSPIHTGKESKKNSNWRPRGFWGAAAETKTATACRRTLEEPENVANE
jgi:hypothetical protein